MPATSACCSGSGARAPERRAAPKAALDHGQPSGGSGSCAVQGPGPSTLRTSRTRRTVGRGRLVARSRVGPARDVRTWCADPAASGTASDSPSPSSEGRGRDGLSGGSADLVRDTLPASSRPPSGSTRCRSIAADSISLRLRRSPAERTPSPRRIRRLPPPTRRRRGRPRRSTAPRRASDRSARRTS